MQPLEPADPQDTATDGQDVPASLQEPYLQLNLAGGLAIGGAFDASASVGIGVARGTALLIAGLLLLLLLALCLRTLQARTAPIAHPAFAFPVWS